VVSKASWRVAGIALLSVVGCEKILDLSEPRDLEATIARTCACEALDNEGSAFVERCDQALAALTESESEQAKTQLLSIGELNCGSCTEVKPCYAAITNAAPEGGDCTLAEECATWACHAGSLTVELVADGRGPPEPEIGVLDDQPSVCAGAECAPCGPAVAAIVSQEDDRPSACAEAKAKAASLLDCIWTRRQGLCLMKCTGVTPSNFPGCLDCLYADPESQERCSAEHATCDNDVARPREAGE
jgi:hypothetical protein